MSSKGLSSKSLDYDCIIIGGGPAGLSAALHLRHFRRSVAIVRSGIPRAAWVPKVHNLAGHAKGLTGPQLLKNLEGQIKALKKVDFFEGTGKLNRVPGKKQTYEVEVSFSGKKSSQKITAPCVIIASGVLDEQPAFPNLLDLRKKALLRYCPICDGYDFRDRPLAILVRDAGGINEAEFIAKYSTDLHVILLDGFEISPRQRKTIRDLCVSVYSKKLERVDADLLPRGLTFHFKGGDRLKVRAAYVALGKKVNDSAYGHLKDLEKLRINFFWSILARPLLCPECMPSGIARMISIKFQSRRGMRRLQQLRFTIRFFELLRFNLSGREHAA